MKKYKLRSMLLSLFLLTSVSFAAEKSEKSDPWTLLSDVTFGLGKNQGQAAVSWKMAYGFWDKMLTVGMGPRFTVLGSNKSHGYKPTTSSNPLNSSLEVEKYVFGALNMAFEVRVAPVKWLEIGANIDLIGFGGGKNASAAYASNSNGFNGAKNTDVPNLNYLAVSRYDRGQLNSEAFLAVRPWDHWAVRAGLSHFRSEIETRGFNDGERRFRRYSNLIFLSLENRF